MPKTLTKSEVMQYLNGYLDAMADLTLRIEWMFDEEEEPKPEPKEEPKVETSANSSKPKPRTGTDGHAVVSRIHRTPGRSKIHQGQITLWKCDRECTFPKHGMHLLRTGNICKGHLQCPSEIGVTDDISN